MSKKTQFTSLGARCPRAAELLQVTESNPDTVQVTHDELLTLSERLASRGKDELIDMLVRAYVELHASCPDKSLYEGDYVGVLQDLGQILDSED